jgi:glycosyltransferase involved in cell wall biosynthesis
MPRVTVGIPFFNEARHLGDAIRAVLAQTFTDFELLLVDDGSQDDSLAIASSFRDPRIKVSSDGTRKHLPARLNEIVARARAPFIARADADDVMHPTRFARQLAVFEEQPSCDVVGTWAVLVDGDEQPFATVESGPIPPTPSSALLHGVLAHTTVMARRDWFVANPYDETLTRTEDRDLWCRTAMSTRFAVVPECLYVVRVEVAKHSFLPGYLQSQRQARRLLAMYGPASLGWLQSARFRVETHAKSVLMRVMMRTGFAEQLIRRRGRPATAHERALALEALAASRDPQRA